MGKAISRQKRRSKSKVTFKGDRGSWDLPSKWMDEEHSAASLGQITVLSSDSAFSEGSSSTRLNEESRLFQHMVDAFQPLIERSVKVMEILPHLYFIEDIETFRNIAKENPSKAVALLIERIKTHRDPGRWQAFMEALEKCGYTYIVTLLRGKTEEDNTTKRKLLRLFTPKLIRRIDPGEFLGHLYAKEVIGEEDMEEIHCEQINRGPTAASLMLLDRIPRKVPDWYELFIDVLKACGLEDCIMDLQGEMTYPRKPSNWGLNYPRFSDNSVYSMDTVPKRTLPINGSGLTMDFPEDPVVDHPSRNPEVVEDETSLKRIQSSDSTENKETSLILQNIELLRTNQEVLIKQNRRLLTELEKVKHDMAIVKAFRLDFLSLKDDIAAVTNNEAAQERDVSKPGNVRNGRTHPRHETHV